MSRNSFDSSTQARQRVLQQVRAAGAGEREQLGQVQGGKLQPITAQYCDYQPITAQYPGGGTPRPRL